MRVATTLQSGSLFMFSFVLIGHTALYLNDLSGFTQRDRMDFPSGKPKQSEKIEVSTGM
jgi:hypothetical protein